MAKKEQNNQDATVEAISKLNKALESITETVTAVAESVGVIKQRQDEVDEAAKQAKAKAAKKKKDDEDAEKTELQKLREEHNATRQQLDSERSYANTEAKRRLIREAATNAGIRSEAILDFEGRAGAAFKLSDDRRSLTGDTSMSDFVSGLRKSAGHLFTPPKGTNTKGGNQTQPNLSGRPDAKVISRDDRGTNLEALAKGEAVSE